MDARVKAFREQTQMRKARHAQYQSLGLPAIWQVAQENENSGNERPDLCREQCRRISAEAVLSSLAPSANYAS